jgi:hypothetical protein
MAELLRSPQAEVTKFKYDKVVQELRDQGHFYFTFGDMVDTTVHIVDPNPAIKFPVSIHHLGILPIHKRLAVRPTGWWFDLRVGFRPSSDTLITIQDELITLSKSSLSRQRQRGEYRQLCEELYEEEAALAKGFLGRKQYASVLASTGIDLSTVKLVQFDTKFPKGTIIRDDELLRKHQPPNY